MKSGSPDIKMLSFTHRLSLRREGALNRRDSAAASAASRRAILQWLVAGQIPPWTHVEKLSAKFGCDFLEVRRRSLLEG